MLYSLAIEPILLQLRAKLQGVTLSDYNFSFKLLAYGDHMSIGSQRDVDTGIKMFNDFNLLSYARVNWGEMVALLLGMKISHSIFMGLLRRLRADLKSGVVWLKNVLQGE